MLGFGGSVISSVRGEVLSVGLDHAVVEVGGVGMAVQATPTTLAGLRRGQSARLETALVVREDSLTLFGFADAAERATELVDSAAFGEGGLGIVFTGSVVTAAEARAMYGRTAV